MTSLLTGPQGLFWKTVEQEGDLVTVQRDCEYGKTLVLTEYEIEISKGWNYV